MAEQSAFRKRSRRLWQMALRYWGASLSLVLTFLFASEELRRAVPTYESQVFERLDYIYYDTRLRLMEPPELTTQPNIVIVDIDEKSLAEQGRWPWSRAVMTELNNQLLDAGVYTITYDIMFSEAERNIALEMARMLDDPEAAQSIAAYEDDVDFDQMFADSLTDAGAVLGFTFYPDERIQVGQLPEPLRFIGQPDLPRLTTVSAGGYVGNLPELQSAAEAGGLINPVADLDGVIRSVALLQEYDDHLYTSLALASVYNYFLYAPDEVNFDIGRDGGRRVFRSVDVAAEGGPNRIDTDAFSRVLVPYAGAQRTFPYISATNIVEGRLTEEEQQLLEGSISLIGTSSIGLLDLRATPLDNAYPGVEIHANLINGLITGDIGHDIQNSHVYTAALMVIFGLLFALWFRRFGPFLLLGVTAASLGLVIGLNYALWLGYWANLSVSALLILIAALGAFNLLEGFLRERSDRKVVHAMFGQYVPAEHIDQMLGADDDYGFSGDYKQLTVLFSDIRGFTPISESLSPTELKDLLNRYFTPITRIIFERQGTIDKYVGDMVMAFWGAPLEDKDHATHAIEAAMDMIAQVNTLKPEFAAEGLPEINVGIGLNTGPMNVGDMGSEYRRAYTVLGDSVNLGARLEALTKFYGVDILVGPDTHDQAPGFVFRFVDLIIVKGKSEPIKAYEPLCREGEETPELMQELADYEAAWAHYRAQRWDDAVAAFESLSQQAPGKRPKLYQVYLERIAEVRTQSLPEDWDGAFRHTSK